jgi:tetratricopeptide (TPR) repeat protein
VVLCLAVESQLLGGDIACVGAESQLRAATQALNAGSLAEAERLLVPLQESHPECGEIPLSLARLRAAQQDGEAADRLFSRAIALAPQDARAYFYFAQFCLSRGDYRRADYLSDHALALDNASPDALVLRGQILVMKGQTSSAQELLEKACALAPGHAEAHYQLGVLFDSKKLHREAAQQFEKVITLRPRDARAYDYLALHLESLGEARNAEKAYLGGLRVNEGPFFDYFLDYNYGRFLLKENRLAESKVHLDRALLLAPQTRAVYYEHGKLNLRLERYQEARLDAERALSLPEPGFILDLQVYYLLATVYSRLGEDALARKYTELCRTARTPSQERK